MEKISDLKLDSFVRKPSFELFLGPLTLSSVVLALVLYVPEIELSTTQNNMIYIFDFFVIGVLSFDFCVRTQASNDSIRYALTHSYEIPAPTDSI